jgi:hypothetical protein
MAALKDAVIFLVFFVTIHDHHGRGHSAGLGELSILAFPLHYCSLVVNRRRGIPIPVPDLASLSRDSCCVSEFARQMK